MAVSPGLPLSVGVVAAALDSVVAAVLKEDVGKGSMGFPSPSPAAAAAAVDWDDNSGTDRVGGGDMGLGFRVSCPAAKTAASTISSALDSKSRVTTP